MNQNGGENPLDALNADQLRERLIVAETIMKQQYARNKELERLLAQQEIDGTSQEPDVTADNVSLATTTTPKAIDNSQMQIMLREFKDREEALERELDHK